MKKTLFPQSKCKDIATSDPDVKEISKQAVDILRKSAEFFADQLLQKIFEEAKRKKRVTANIQDFNNVVSKDPVLLQMLGQFFSQSKTEDEEIRENENEDLNESENEENEWNEGNEEIEENDSTTENIDSLISSNVNEILCLPNVSESIRLNFIFCAIECTTPEGWEIAINFKFEKIPIIGILRPHGDTLKQCDLLVKHEGPIGEVGIISYFSIVHQNETNSSIIQQQDIEYLRAVQEAEANNMTTQEIEEEALHNEQIRIEEEFNNLPVLSEDDDASVVRFRFPDSTTQVRAFPRDGPAKMMYTFVRKFMFPNRFKLLVGFPMQEIQDDNTPIRMLSPMNHFIVLVGDDS
ncbi:hypothetical protein GPJ56_007704 [Histomonas meleagridis]|uniref:uncharacterized protein n=1 Tax=Histomonas meleagridis TaxID=135588 RepID=UPI0035599222|nr:hypothetical protein GPJ56_007704 [Histomonas meleagridis]KAH0805897.1 hypothetical protein GO595_001331 [Histomonas meleagridis]